MKKFYAIILLSCLLVACSKAKQDPNDDPAFAPVVNPHPQYFMTVKGFIDPKLPKGLVLKIILYFQTKSQSCEYVDNPLVGPMPHDKTITLTAQTDKEGNYKLDVPLDYFRQDKCNWTIQLINYSIKGTGYSPIPLATFNTEKIFPNNFKKSINIKIVCDKSLNCDWLEAGPYDTAIPRNNNYIYQINIKEKKHD